MGDRRLWSVGDRVEVEGKRGTLTGFGWVDVTYDGSRDIRIALVDLDGGGVAMPDVRKLREARHG